MRNTREFDSYFDLLQERVRFSETIFRSDHEDEAILLCSAFLDGLANARYLDHGTTKRNFVRLLCEYGQNPVFPQIHPLQVKFWLGKANRGWMKSVGLKIEQRLQKLRGKVYPPDEFIEHVSGPLCQNEADKLAKALWNGNVASIVYTNLRCRAVHQLHVSPVSFGDTRFNGQPLERMDFPFLMATLESIVEGLRAYSKEKEKLFGHDFLEWRDA